MSSDKIQTIFGISLFLLIVLLLIGKSVYAMGGRPEQNVRVQEQTNTNLNSVPESKITLKELANVYWPDSNATQVQQEETLKNLLGKKVNWEITVAQIQRNGTGYLIQGQSNKDMMGTFSYVQPQNEVQNAQILNASMGSKINITGIVSDMEMRHIVIKPAFISTTD